MQAYGESMAMAYDTIWGAYAQKAARAIMAFQGAQTGRNRGRILDVCCGAGQFAEIFLREGFEVVGVDLSASMLERAKARCRPWVEAGKAQFLEADAGDFETPGKFELIVSTYDALNHLDSLGALENCFRCVHRAAAPGASFIFDFSTLKGLDEWNRITVSDKEAAAVITRGFFDAGTNKGYKKFTGFLKGADGSYSRFEEVIFARGYPLASVQRALQSAGFEDVRATMLDDLGGRLMEAEAQDRVVFVSRTSAAS